MSYCRFSSANWKSDVYVYDGSEGITIHVATHRRIGQIPKLPHILETEPEEFHEAYIKHMKAVDRCKLEEIDNPLAGTTSCHRTALEAIDELRYLQLEGFFAPEFVFDDLLQYVREEDESAK